MNFFPLSCQCQQFKIPRQILTSEKAAILAGIDPDYNSRDLYTEIAAKNFPKWNVEIVCTRDIF